MPSDRAPRRGLGRGLIGGLTAMLVAASLAAQEPPAPVPPDTVPVAPDTLPPPDTAVVPIPPEQVAQDTIPVEEPDPEDAERPPPRLPVFPSAAPAGFAFGEWEADQTVLARWHGMSLLALLEEVPGLMPTRGGWYGRPAGLAAFGSGGGRLRVFLDGFELDPLDAASLDVQNLAIVDLTNVRIQRTLTETRIELTTFRQPDRRAFSQIEAGTAIFRTRILRGLFSTPIGDRHTVTLGLDLTDTDGWVQQQPASLNSLLGRWTVELGDRAGIQLEYRQAAVDRAGAPFTAEAERRNLVLRARAQPLEGLTLDAIGGRNWRTPGDADTLRMELESLQGAVRARYDAGPGWLGAGLRLRDGAENRFAVPSLDASLDAGLRPLSWLTARAEARHSRAAGIGGTELQGGVRLGPFGGLSVFANAATGSRAIGLARDTVFEVLEPDPEDPEGDPVIRLDSTFVFPAMASDLHAFRAGAEWSRWGAQLGGAYVLHDLDAVAPFGLAFDRAIDPLPVAAASALEAYGSIPLGTPMLRVEGSYTHWLDTGGRPYLPADYGRFGLRFHGLFYEGNLEPTLRVEGVHRAASLVPTQERDAFGAIAQPYTVFNIFLQIRVLDVRAFLIWDNIANNQLAADLVGPGRALGGQRAIYGVRWHFFD